MNLREPVPPFVYLPLRQPRAAERRLTLLVLAGTPGGEMALLPSIRSALAHLDSGLLISEVITVRRQMDSTLLTERLLSGLSSAFGILALTLAAIGLYGVLSYRIGRQRHAIGIQMALGASPSSAAFNILRQSALVVAAGLLAGMPFAFLAARAAAGLFWDIAPTDPAIYLLPLAMLCLVASAAAWFPARRAAAVNPAETLRSS